MKRIAIFLLAVLSSALLGAQQSGEAQAARQARSVHLHYRKWEGPAQVFYIEATPEQSTPGSYFCLLGFDGGYCGIQELLDGTHIAIFSIWEPSNPHDLTADQSVVPEHMRTKILYHGENVHVQRFGGEGTGGKSMMPLKWEINQPVRMAISVDAEGGTRSTYTCWVWDERKSDWFRMATFSTLYTKGVPELTGPYSFVEDFRRDVHSKEETRRARFSRLWVYNGSIWTACTEAVFTADKNTLTSIDAGPSQDGFWMTTGGPLTNATTQLWGRIKPGEASDESAARRVRLIQLVEELKAQ